MKKYLLASMLIIGPCRVSLCGKEIAPSSPTKHFAVKDTVGVCRKSSAIRPATLQKKKQRALRSCLALRGLLSRAGRQLQFDHKR